MIYKGSCHCRSITFEVEAPASIKCLDCNCSICSMTGYWHLIVPKSQFNLCTGEDKLTTYSWGTGVAQHTFCSVCGVKPFYIPRSNPDGVDVNVRCLEAVSKLEIEPFDGKNWEEHSYQLAHLSNQGNPNI